MEHGFSQSLPCSRSSLLTSADVKTRDFVLTLKMDCFRGNEGEEKGLFSASAQNKQMFDEVLTSVGLEQSHSRTHTHPVIRSLKTVKLSREMDAGLKR